MFDSCLSQTPLNPILSGWASEKNINPDKIITKMAARTSGNCFVLLVFFFAYFFFLFFSVTMARICDADYVRRPIA